MSGENPSEKQSFWWRISDRGDSALWARGADGMEVVGQTGNGRYTDRESAEQPAAKGSSSRKQHRAAGSRKQQHRGHSRAAGSSRKQQQEAA